MTKHYHTFHWVFQTIMHAVVRWSEDYF